MISAGIVLVLCMMASVGMLENNHAIAKRYVLFPQYTVLQFTYGLSAPLILPSRSINLSWAVQSNYDLPFNLSNFELLYGRAQDDALDLDIDRNTFYEYIINILEGFGVSGEDCLLKSICEIADIPMHIQDSDSLLEKIVHFMLTPSIDFTTNNGMNDTIEHKVLVAEHLGKMRGHCEEVFVDCDISLIDIFTNKFNVF